MHYVCIENNQLIGVLNYQPTVPSTVTVVQISDAQAGQLQEGTHYFDIPSKTVQATSAATLSQKQQETANAQERHFLESTDWKVMRHIRQKVLGVPTTLSEAQYLELEQQRHQAASRIV